MIFELLKNRTKLVRKRSAHRLKIFFKYHFKRDEKEPIFIITTRRTGSNLLLGYLNSIPGVSFAPEVLNKSMYYGIRKGASKRTALRHIAHSLNDRKHKICGAKFVRVHLENHGVSLEDLKGHFPTARFIILYRRSLLDQFVSLKVAEATDAWEWSKKFVTPSSVVVRTQELSAYCRAIRGFYRDLLRRAWLKECSIVLSYEELALSPQQTFDRRVFPFLGLPSSRITSSTKKQITKELREIVQNYADVAPWIGHPLTTQEYPFLQTEEDVPEQEPQVMFG